MIAPTRSGHNSNPPPCRDQSQHPKPFRACLPSSCLRGNASDASLAAPSSRSNCDHRSPSRRCSLDSRLPSDEPSSRRSNRLRLGIAMGYGVTDTLRRGEKKLTNAGSRSHGRPVCCLCSLVEVWCGILSLRRLACIERESQRLQRVLADLRLEARSS